MCLQGTRARNLHGRFELIADGISPHDQSRRFSEQDASIPKRETAAASETACLCERAVHSLAVATSVALVSAAPAPAAVRRARSAVRAKPVRARVAG